MVDIPVSSERPPAPDDNPRHYVFLAADADKPLRKITPANPGEETINVEGVLYRHSHETAPAGRWVYTQVSV